MEACEGQVEAHGDLLEDSKKRILGLEAQADTWAAKYDADTAALSVSLKESQAAKAECVGKSEQSDTLIAECKKTVGQPFSHPGVVRMLSEKTPRGFFPTQAGLVRKIGQ